MGGGDEVCAGETQGNAPLQTAPPEIILLRGKLSIRRVRLTWPSPARGHIREPRTCASAPSLIAQGGIITLLLSPDFIKHKDHSLSLRPVFPWTSDGTVSGHRHRHPASIGAALGQWIPATGIKFWLFGGSVTSGITSRHTVSRHPVSQLDECEIHGRTAAARSSTGQIKGVIRNNLYKLEILVIYHRLITFCGRL